MQRCAIYTRKSSEEGLEQGFNSLDAQREAGEAYVKSQASEGWKPLATRYDDGGYSGGTMERPALKRLLADIDAGKIDVVVVYKIDRLTRSLADFARIVERFDARGISFVSVTQAFNTTSSMGRLTLNVLLSFAQFEREVTGERIRDKIAASKAKGMWMGGRPPLGYDPPLPGSRMLIVNTDEAASVRHIFAHYLALGSVHRLEEELARDGILSKRWTGATGKVSGGVPYSRGALFHLLANRLYLGQIVHKTAVYPGQHEAIVSADLFEAVQAQLAAQRRRHAAKAPARTVRALLTGKIFDAAGAPMSPTFSSGRGGRIYRYYVSAPLQRGVRPKPDDLLRRVPAPAIEALTKRWMHDLTDDPSFEPLLRVEVAHEQLVLTVKTKAIRTVRFDGCVQQAEVDGTSRVIVAVSLPLRGGGRSIAAGQKSPLPDPNLVGALRRAHAMLEKAPDGGRTMSAAPVSWYERQVLRLAFLAPELQQSILAGTQPRHVNLEFLVRSEIPLDWTVQRATLHWSA
jgi:DNA invertase Pin-like site-specific DNA recombinase